MSSRSFPLPVLPGRGEIAARQDTSLPCSRAAAVHRWVTALWTVAFAQCAVVLVGTAFHGDLRIGDGVVNGTVHSVVGALALPLLFVSMVRYTERRLLRRPPKALLCAQLSLFVLGAAAATVGSLGIGRGGAGATAIFALGHGALAASALLLAIWFTGALLVAAIPDELR